ncbi:hypothetical protein Pint_26753 [Pistacia integerrima]|uniref:Uncharacterized protein n=1 Tax=Pistacia integerrima TaxID=434235 RepID=A0ACC0YQW7_9ROSI|nr:hypothetical protein Pint_26753 [Pistacia integerrima]
MIALKKCLSWWKLQYNWTDCPKHVEVPHTTGKVWKESGVLMAFLQRLILKRKPVLYGNCRRSICSLLSAVPSDDDDSSSLPPQMLPFDYQPKPYLGPCADKFLRKESVFWVLLCSIKRKMQHLFDESGRRYLDAFAGIVTVSCGHCHPDVVNAITEQINLLQHATTIYLHHAMADFAEALA